MPLSYFSAALKAFRKAMSSPHAAVCAPYTRTNNLHDRTFQARMHRFRDHLNVRNRRPGSISDDCPGGQPRIRISRVNSPSIRLESGSIMAIVVQFTQPWQRMEKGTTKDYISHHETGRWGYKPHQVEHPWEWEQLQDVPHEHVQVWDIRIRGYSRHLSRSAVVFPTQWARNHCISIPNSLCGCCLKSTYHVADKEILVRGLKTSKDRSSQREVRQHNHVLTIPFLVNNVLLVKVEGPVWYIICHPYYLL